MSKKDRHPYKINCTFVPNLRLTPQIPEELSKVSKPIRVERLSNEPVFENQITQPTSNDFEDMPFEDIESNKKSTHKPIPKNQFVPIFHYYIEKGLKGYPLLLYAMICSFVCTSETHTFYGGKNFIASWLGCDGPNANKTLKKLENSGLILRTGEKGRRGTTEYTIPTEDLSYINELFDEAIIREYRLYKKKKEIDPFELLKKQEQAKYLREYLKS